MDAKGRRLCPACFGAAQLENEQGLIDLAEPDAAEKADQGDGPILMAPLPKQNITRAPCPNCHAAMEPGQVRCGSCGKVPSLYETRHGPREPEEVPKGVTLLCGECGYDLAGLKDLVCPECGTRATLPSRSEMLEEDSVEIAMWEYQKPAIMAAIGFVLALLITAASGTWSDAGWYALAFPFRVLVASGAMLLCGVLWVGVDAPFRLVLARFAGILGLVDLASTLLSSTTLPGRGFLVFSAGGVLYVYLLVELFELELSDAWGVAVVTLIVNIFSFAMLFWVLSII